MHSLYSCSPCRYQPSSEKGGAQRLLPNVNRNPSSRQAFTLSQPMNSPSPWTRTRWTHSGNSRRNCRICPATPASPPLPADDPPVARAPNALAALGQQPAELPNLPRPLSVVHRPPPPLRAAQVLPRLCHKAQHRPQPLLASMLGVVSLARSLDGPVHGAHRRVDVHGHPPRPVRAQGPHLPPQRRPQLQQRGRLHDRQRPYVPPERAHRRHHRHAQHPADHRVVAHIRKVPQPLKPNEQQHQDPQHHAISAQFRFPLRGHIVVGKRLLKPNQVQKLDQRQQPPEGRQPLRAFPVWRLRRDPHGTRHLHCPGPVRPLLSTPVCLTLAFNHRGYLLSAWPLFNPANPTGGTRWFPNRFSAAQCKIQVSSLLL